MDILKKGILIFCIMVLVAGCFRLDQNLFNHTNTDQYLLDDYEGEVDFRPGSEFDIPEDQIHLLTFFSGPENVQIYGVYIGDTTTINRDTVIYYLHGNRDHMDFYWPRAKLLAGLTKDMPVGVLMIDYRGFGRSAGIPSEQGLYEDAEAGLEWLISRGVRESRLMIYGFSLGSAPATYLASKTDLITPAKLILENPFASSDVMVADAALLNMPGSYFTDYRIAVSDMITGVHQPLLWIHGVEDDFLNIDTHGEVVYRNYPGTDGKAIRVNGAGHGNVPPVMGFENYLAAIRGFLQGN